MKAAEFLEKLANLDLEKLQNEKGVGKILSKNIQDFLNSSRFLRLKKNFEQMERAGNNIEIKILKSGVKNGKSVVITGSFEVSREKIKEKLENLGFQVQNSISKNVDFLLVGEKAGSKLEKAEKLGVKIVKDINQLQ